jgi:hypothetical protein
MESDELYQHLQSYYSEIAEIPRDALILMSSYPFNKKTAGISSIQKRLLKHESTDRLGADEKVKLC